MICMGAGTNHWFHSDETYRSFIALLLLSGCVGINGGGWAHYVGQEKIRTFAGWQQLAFGMDWRRPGRQAQGTTWYHTHTEQWRYDRLRPEQFASPLGEGHFAGMTSIDAHAKAVRMGWMPSYPAVGPQPARPRRRGARRRASTRSSTSWPSSRRAACTTPSRTRAPRSNFPRVFFVWRSNLLGSSGKGQEYFLRHLLGAAHDGPLAEPLPEGERPTEVTLARRDPQRQARPAGQRRLPDDDDRPVLGRRPAGRDVVREARPVDDRHASVHPLVQPGGAAAVGGAQRLGLLRRDRPRVQRARRRAPGRAHGHRLRPGPARHAGRDHPAARRGPRLAGGRVRGRSRAGRCR